MNGALWAVHLAKATAGAAVIVHDDAHLIPSHSLDNQPTCRANSDASSAAQTAVDVDAHEAAVIIRQMQSPVWILDGLASTEQSSE